MPLRCFKCNRFGHIAEKCSGKERCAKRGKEHNTFSCSITNVIAMKCATCNGNHSAASKICPKYLREAQVLKYQTKKKLTYAEACRKYNRATNSPRNGDARQSQSLSKLREFPPLPGMLDSLNHFLTLENFLLYQHQMGLAPSTQGLTCNRSKKNCQK